MSLSGRMSQTFLRCSRGWNEWSEVSGHVYTKCEEIPLKQTSGVWLQKSKVCFVRSQWPWPLTSIVWSVHPCSWDMVFTRSFSSDHLIHSGWTARRLHWDMRCSWFLTLHFKQRLPLNRGWDIATLPEPQHKHKSANTKTDRWKESGLNTTKWFETNKQEQFRIKNIRLRITLITHLRCPVSCLWSDELFPLQTEKHQ